MAKENQYRNNKFEILDVLDDIRSRYQGITAANIEAFAPVYYPIAIVEMTLDERTFEDFETVHLTILRLMSLGISDHRIIAQTLGLSPNYVFKILRVLAGYGHINGTELTDLGRESLSSGQKIITTQTIQKFQVDALNGTLIRVRETVTSNTLSSKDETSVIIGHLDYLDGITFDSLSNQLTGSTCENYLNQKSGILHTNVTAVRDARCLEIKYAKCYLLKLRDQHYPIIFTKRYDRTEKNIKKRFSWHPISVCHMRLAPQYGFDPAVPVSTPLANDYLEKLYAMLAEAIRPDKLEEEIPKAISRAYPFQEAGLRFAPPGYDGSRRVMISEEAFDRYRRQLVVILRDLHRTGSYLVTSEYLYGHMVSIQTESPKVRALAELLCAKIDQHGQLKVTQHLAEYFRDAEEGSSVADNMTAALQQL